MRYDYCLSFHLHLYPHLFCVGTVVIQPKCSVEPTLSQHLCQGVRTHALLVGSRIPTDGQALCMSSHNQRSCEAVRKVHPQLYVYQHATTHIAYIKIDFCSHVKSTCRQRSRYVQNTSRSSNGNGKAPYQDPLDVYCEDNPETDECRYVKCTLLK